MKICEPQGPKMTQLRVDNKWVERVVKFAKEQITMGRNYGWTVDTLSEELNQLITKTQQETLEEVEKEYKTVREDVHRIIATDKEFTQENLIKFMGNAPVQLVLSGVGMICDKMDKALHKLKVKWGIK